MVEYLRIQYDSEETMERLYPLFRDFKFELLCSFKAKGMISFFNKAFSHNMGAGKYPLFPRAAHEEVIDNVKYYTLIGNNVSEEMIQHLQNMRKYQTAEELKQYMAKEILYPQIHTKPVSKPTTIIPEPKFIG